MEKSGSAGECTPWNPSESQTAKLQTKRQNRPLSPIPPMENAHVPFKVTTIVRRRIMKTLRKRFRSRRSTALVDPTRLTRMAWSFTTRQIIACRNRQSRACSPPPTPEAGRRATKTRRQSPRMACRRRLAVVPSRRTLNRLVNGPKRTALRKPPPVSTRKSTKQLLTAGRTRAVVNRPCLRKITQRRGLARPLASTLAAMERRKDY